MSSMESTPSDWEDALDRIEADLDRAEVLVRHPGEQDLDVAPWAAPTLDTPMPPHLRERARLLLSRQRAVLALLTPAQDRLRRQQALTGRIRNATGRPGTASVYVDAHA